MCISTLNTSLEYAFIWLWIKHDLVFASTIEQYCIFKRYFIYTSVFIYTQKYN